MNTRLKSASFRLRLHPGLSIVLAICAAGQAWSQTPPAVAPTPAPIPSDMITQLRCFRDPGGNLHGLAEEVASKDGQVIGWISISQCPATGAADTRLHVRLSGSFGDDMVIFSPSEVTAHADGIVLTLSAAEVRARFPHAVNALSSSLYPIGSTAP